jgi:hypothetical protein
MMPLLGIKELAVEVGTLLDGHIADYFGVSMEAAYYRLEVIKSGKLGSF